MKVDDSHTRKDDASFASVVAALVAGVTFLAATPYVSLHEAHTANAPALTDPQNVVGDGAVGQTAPVYGHEASFAS